jgi:hypothetical protein
MGCSVRRRDGSRTGIVASSIIDLRWRSTPSFTFSPGWYECRMRKA